MEKLLNKKIVASVCGALLAFSGIAIITHGGLTARAAEATQNNRIVLNTGAGTFGEISEQAVTTIEDGKLPELPVPVREGWEFVGWFDQEVVENFWGDEQSENPDIDDYKQLKATYSSYKNIYYQGEITPVAELDSNFDSGWKELTFSWISATKGDIVKAGDRAISNTLYAMYKPVTYTVYWHFNGWLNQYNAPHRTMPEHGGYFVEYELDQFASLKWENHTFLGWYTDPECTEEYKFTKVGAYKINEKTVDGDLLLYAKWESSTPFDGEIRIKKSPNLTEPKLDSTFTVNCAYSLGESRDMPVITKWESSEPEAIVLVSSDSSSASAVFAVRNTEIFKDGNKQVTIYVTVDGERYPAADLTFGHTWGGIVSEKLPTCTEAGQTVYRCKFCDETKVVKYAADGHRFIQTEHPATCTENAFVETYCIVCGLGETKIKENSKLEHNLSTQIIANCNGTTFTTTCTACGLTETTFDGNAVVHDWDSKYTVDKTATCVAEGEKSVHCRSCNARQYITAIPATESHVWSEWRIVKEATATEAGIQSRSCEICEKTDTQEIPVLSTEPELPHPEEPETGALETDDVNRVENEEIAIAKSVEMSNTSYGAQGESNNGVNAFLYIIALAGFAVILIGVGVFAIRRQKNKNK